MKGPQVFLLVCILALMGVGGLYVLGSAQNPSSTVSPVSPQSDGTTSQSEVLPIVPTAVPTLAQDYLLTPSDQKPGLSVKLAKARLAASGFIVVYDWDSGEIGRVLGSSALLTPGEHQSIDVALNRTVKNGETLFAKIHPDRNTNGTFEPETDTPAESPYGGPVLATFMIDASAKAESEIIP